jgi:hypothetical protein
VVQDRFEEGEPYGLLVPLVSYAHHDVPPGRSLPVAAHHHDQVGVHVRTVGSGYPTPPVPSFGQARPLLPPQ